MLNSVVKSVLGASFEERLDAIKRSLKVRRTIKKAKKMGAVFSAEDEIIGCESYNSIPNKKDKK